MSIYERQRSELVSVASVPRFARAEFIQMTLAAHGYQSAVRARSVVYPSVDFVEGADVWVIADNAAAVRQLLADLEIPVTFEGSDPPDAQS